MTSNFDEKKLGEKCISRLINGEASWWKQVLEHKNISTS